MKKIILVIIAIFICINITGCKNNESQVNSNIDNTINNVNDKETKTITLKFDSNGGTEVNDIVVNLDETINKPQDPTREGYVFLGWYYKESLFDFTVMPDEDIVLIAKWQKLEEKQYEINFNTNGGSSIEKQIVKKSEKVKQPKNPVKSGYIFVEWQLDGKKYNFNSNVSSNITLVAKWKKQETVHNSATTTPTTTTQTYTKYKNDAFNMQYCYTEESVLANSYKVVENVKVGDRIVCEVSFETYSTDKVKNFQYTLTYGSGLKLVKEYYSGVENGNTYSFILSKPVSVGDNRGMGQFTFEVVGTTGLTYGIKDIKFTTSDNKNYYNNNLNYSLKYVPGETYTKYKNDAFSMRYCYTEESVLANSYKLVENVKVGDRIVCEVSFETYSTDKVKNFQYTLTYGSGLKLVKEYYSGVENGNTYSFILSKPVSVGDNRGMGHFTFEVVGTTGLTYGIKDIKFTTSDNKYYYDNDHIYTLKVK